MLKIVGIPNANLRGSNPLGGGGAPYPVPIGTPLDLEWVPINDPENLSHPNNFVQGWTQGGADFRRPEGMWYGDESIYFVSTDGGQSTQGQVFCLDLRKQELTLIYDSPNPEALDNPDNLVITPRGGLIFCEDNSGNPAFLLDGVSTERLVGLTRDGRIFTFATNLLDFSGSLPTSMAPYTRPNNSGQFNQNYRAQEWAGATFDRSGEWLFVNIQTPGVTFAITGPWGAGPL
jgi:secreted PhoX family phosphatase